MCCVVCTWSATLSVILAEARMSGWCQCFITLLLASPSFVLSCFYCCPWIQPFKVILCSCTSILMNGSSAHLLLDWKDSPDISLSPRLLSLHSTFRSSHISTKPSLSQLCYWHSFLIIVVNELLKRIHVYHYSYYIHSDLQCSGKVNCLHWHSQAVQEAVCNLKVHPWIGLRWRSVSLVSSSRHVSRRPDVHGAEEALLSAHLAAVLDRPPLEDVLRCAETSQSSQKWSDHREPLQRWV